MSSARSNGDPRRPPARTGDAAGDPVTTGLKRLFAAIEEEPIPDDFLRLLDAIDEQRGAVQDDDALPPGAGKKAG